jgi:hypothetical protein
MRETILMKQLPLYSSLALPVPSAPAPPSLPPQPAAALAPSPPASTFAPPPSSMQLLEPQTELPSTRYENVCLARREERRAPASGALEGEAGFDGEDGPSSSSSLLQLTEPNSLDFGAAAFVAAGLAGAVDFAAAVEDDAAGLSAAFGATEAAVAVESTAPSSRIRCKVCG